MGNDRQFQIIYRTFFFTKFYNDCSFDIYNDTFQGKNTL